MQYKSDKLVDFLNNNEKYITPKTFWIGSWTTSLLQVTRTQILVGGHEFDFPLGPLWILFLNLLRSSLVRELRASALKSREKLLTPSKLVQ